VHVQSKWKKTIKMETVHLENGYNDVCVRVCVLHEYLVLKGAVDVLTKIEHSYCTVYNVQEHYFLFCVYDLHKYCSEYIVLLGHMIHLLKMVHLNSQYRLPKSIQTSLQP